MKYIFISILIIPFYLHCQTPNYEGYYLYQSVYPDDDDAFWFPNDTEVQGVTNDGDNWFITTTGHTDASGTDYWGKLWKIPKSVPLSASSSPNPNIEEIEMYNIPDLLDNVGRDIGEFIEVAGTAGVDLSTYSLVLYNGNDGASYNTIALAGIIPDAGAGFGAIAFTLPPNGLQNGSPDGIALVEGMVVHEFLSYEGAFVAADGPAMGMMSVDIGVSEPGTTPIEESLQLCGTGV